MKSKASIAGDKISIPLKVDEAVKPEPSASMIVKEETGQRKRDAKALDKALKMQNILPEQ